MDAKLNHSDLISLLAKGNNISVAKAELFTKNFFDLIIEGLEQDGIVKINGLGTFRITDVASRGSVNVNTGEKIEIKGHKKLTFTPADALKECVNQPFAMFEPVEVDDTYQPDVETADAEVDETTDDNADNLADAQVVQPMNTIEENELPQVVEEPVESVEEIVVEEKKEEETVSAETENMTEQVAETKTPATVQEKPAEPVMVRVPNKKSTPAQQQAPTGKKKRLWRLVISLIMGFIAGFVIINMMGREERESVGGEPQNSIAASSEIAAVVPETTYTPEVVPAAQESTDELTTNPDEGDTVTVEQTVDAAAVGAEPVTESLAQEMPYEFIMVEKLAATKLKDITLADTTLYFADGDLTQHTVAPDETLTRIARQYYGDKKLWPYIVKYNNMANPNGLANGMKIAIPRLLPKK